MKLFRILLLLIFISMGLVSNVYSATLDEMIGQMILVGFEGKSTFSSDYKALKKQIEKGQITGVILFSKNISSPEQLAKLTENLKSIKSKEPIFISIDQEGGNVSRLNKKNGFDNFLSFKDLGNLDSQKIETEYSKMIKLLKKYNFNLNFSPCVDLDTNPESIISKKNRSFSNNPYIVAEKSKIIIDVQNKYNIISCLKHFPGHGSALGDTHLSYVDTTDTWSWDELIPYQELKDQKNIMIMISHVYNQKLDSIYPASMSYTIVTDLLRKYIQYDGVIISDDLDMKAIKDNYNLENIIINVINSGSDILLFSNYEQSNPKLAYEVTSIIKKAIKEKKIKEDRIEESYNRILKLKREAL